METISVQQNQILTDLCSTSSSFGELIVSGKHVNETYFENPQANLENKILDENNVIWHRTGDIAQMDSQGRIWLKGRLKSLIYLENGKAILPLEIESFFNKMNNVIRTALQKIGNDIVLWVQTKNSECRNELTEQFKNHISKRDIPIKKLIFLDEIPVDGRHQSKVDYVSLKSLADIREGIEIEI